VLVGSVTVAPAPRVSLFPLLTGLIMLSRANQFFIPKWGSTQDPIRTPVFCWLCPDIHRQRALWNECQCLSSLHPPLSVCRVPRPNSTMERSSKPINWHYGIGSPSHVNLFRGQKVNGQGYKACVGLSVSILLIPIVSFKCRHQTSCFSLLPQNVFLVSCYFLQHSSGSVHRI